MDPRLLGKAVTEAIHASGAATHVPSQCNVLVIRSIDPGLYHSRNLIDCSSIASTPQVSQPELQTALNVLAAIHPGRSWINHSESMT